LQLAALAMPRASLVAAGQRTPIHLGKILNLGKQREDAHEKSRDASPPVQANQNVEY
jgi:hypothetical protein